MHPRREGRLRHRGRDESDRSWTEAFLLLQGAEADGSDGGLVFRWPDSPMRLAVDIYPDAEEGPIALEIGAERPVASLDAAGDLLGIRLIPRSS